MLQHTGVQWVSFTIVATNLSLSFIKAHILTSALYYQGRADKLLSVHLIKVNKYFGFVFFRCFVMRHLFCVTQLKTEQNLQKSSVLVHFYVYLCISKKKLSYKLLFALKHNYIILNVGQLNLTFIKIKICFKLSFVKSKCYIVMLKNRYFSLGKRVNQICSI